MSRKAMTQSDVPPPRLLFLSQTLPYPPDGGVKIRTYHILRLLAREFDVTALCFYRRGWNPDPATVAANVEALSEVAGIEAFAIPQEHSRARLLSDHARSVIRGQTYTVFGYQSREFRAALERALARSTFNVVHADSLDLSAYFPLLDGLPIVCTHHDATSVQLRRRGETERSRLQGAYIRLQGRLMEREEARWCGRVALNATVSETDAEVLRGVAPDGRFVVVPNGVDTEFFQPGEGSGETIVCVGSLGWFPNRDALEFLADRILPELRALGVAQRPVWVGQATADAQARYREEHGVEVTGHVPDIRPYVRDAACYVVPIRSGGGTRIKILDAWAMGKAVVSTTVGCEGLDTVDGENILIRDEPAGFARAVRDVVSDRGLRERLERNGRATVERSYSWDSIGTTMIEHYMQLIDGHAPRAEAVR
jgi:polysaccharide biosynthesis protein PslH